MTETVFRFNFLKTKFLGVPLSREIRRKDAEFWAKNGDRLAADSSVSRNARKKRKINTVRCAEMVLQCFPRD